MRSTVAAVTLIALCAPAPGPAIACEATTHQVYYDRDGRLIPETSAVFDDVARRWNNLPDDKRRIVLRGHTDAVGDAGDNLVRSAEVARAARDQLMARGVLQSAIILEAYGESRPQAPTPDGVIEPLNRRVEIRMETTGPACPVLEPPATPKAQ